MTDHHRLVDMSHMFEDATAELEWLRVAFGLKEGLGAASSALAALIFFMAEHTGRATAVRVLRSQADFLEALPNNGLEDSGRRVVQ